MGKAIEGGGWVATVEDITERKRADTRIAHMAHYDALTDLPNRVLFRERLDHGLTKLSPGQQLAVLYIDIDEFKRINDSLGHPVGDELLKAVAGRLRDLRRGRRRRRPARRRRICDHPGRRRPDRPTPWT